MENLPVLLHHVDLAEFPNLTIEIIVDDVWDMVTDRWWAELPIDFLKFKIGMTFVLQFQSSNDADRSKPKTEKKYARYWIEITETGVRHELIGEFFSRP